MIFDLIVLYALGSCVLFMLSLFLTNAFYGERTGLQIWALGTFVSALVGFVGSVWRLFV